MLASLIKGFCGTLLEAVFSIKSVSSAVLASFFGGLRRAFPEALFSSDCSSSKAVLSIQRQFSRSSSQGCFREISHSPSESLVLKALPKALFRSFPTATSELFELLRETLRAAFVRLLWETGPFFQMLPKGKIFRTLCAEGRASSTFYVFCKKGVMIRACVMWLGGVRLGVAPCLEARCQVRPLNSFHGQ